MPTFSVNSPIVTATPTIAVDAATGLKVGKHVFQLVVTDDSGNASQPGTAQVIVIDKDAPTAVLDAPASVAFNAGFTLSGARSADIGGKIVQYTWTLLS